MIHFYMSSIVQAKMKSWIYTRFHLKKIYGWWSKITNEWPNKTMWTFLVHLVLPGYILDNCYFRKLNMNELFICGKVFLRSSTKKKWPSLYLLSVFEIHFHQRRAFFNNFLTWSQIICLRLRNLMKSKRLFGKFRCFSDL